MEDLKKLIREVPDFPKPGILFYDITTLLKDKAGFRNVIDGLKEHYRDAKVDVVMGTIISLERSATLSVTSRAKKLFFYPTNFEGGECNRYFVATGPIPMQQVDPMAPWIAANLGKTIYIMGSDYAWPRKMTEAISAAIGKTKRGSY